MTLKISLVSFYVAQEALVYQGIYIFHNLVISFLVVDFNVYIVYLVDPLVLIAIDTILLYYSSVHFVNCDHVETTTLFSSYVSTI